MFSILLLQILFLKSSFTMNNYHWSCFWGNFLCLDLFKNCLFLSEKHCEIFCLKGYGTHLQWLTFILRINTLTTLQSKIHMRVCMHVHIYIQKKCVQELITQVKVFSSKGCTFHYHLFIYGTLWMNYFYFSL